jgi:hypothetical protein
MFKGKNLSDSGGRHYGAPMTRTSFQCPKCGFGDYEVGHLVAESDIYCVVCLEEQGRQIRVECWEEGEGAQARLREGLVVA